MLESETIIYFKTSPKLIPFSDYSPTTPIDRLLRLLPCSDTTLRPLHFIDYSENTLNVIPIPNLGFNTLFFALDKPIIIISIGYFKWVTESSNLVKCNSKYNLLSNILWHPLKLTISLSSLAIIVIQKSHVPIYIFLLWFLRASICDQIISKKV